MAEQSGLERMRADWDRRARENARYYVESSRRDWTDEEFRQSGVDSVRELVLDDAERLFGGRDPSELRMLEIGCGVGRMTLAFAEAFGEVHGVDVSGEMVERARKALEGKSNAQVHRNNGCDLEALGDLRFDFAFSFIVFQHIPDIEVVERYVSEVARVLEPNGVFKFQVQGGWRSPGEQRDTWLGCHVTAQHILDWFERYGLELFHFDGVGSQYFWIWARKPATLPERNSAFQQIATETSLLEQELLEKNRWVERLGKRLERLGSELDDRTAWALQLDRRLETYAKHLQQIYGSPAYRVGRRLGLAPEPIEPDDE